MNTLPFLVLACAGASAAAEPVVYDIDPAHTYPSFEADHMGISVLRGKMNRSSGRVWLDKTAGSGRVEIAVDMSSIDFGLDALNAWAAGDQFFESAKFPTAQFKGDVAYLNGEPRLVAGTLAWRGVTRPLTLRIERFKCVPHPLYKRELCGADAYGRFQRDEFGLSAGKEHGFSMDVDLRIQVEAIAVDTNGSK